MEDDKRNTRDLMEEERSRLLQLEKDRVNAEAQQREEHRKTAAAAFDEEKKRIMEEQAEAEANEKLAYEKRREEAKRAAEDERKRLVRQALDAQTEEERARRINEERQREYEEQKASYDRHCAIIKEQEVERQRRILESQEIMNKIAADVASNKLAQEGGFDVEALYDYVGHEEHLLSFKKGDKIAVKEVNETGWWTGELNGKQGPFPSNYVSRLVDGKAE